MTAAPLSTAESELSGRADSRVGPAARFTAVSLMLAALTSACDPCSGLAQCASGTYLAVDGQVVDVGSHGVGGVRIDVVRRAGSFVATDSMSTLTRPDGHWRVEFETNAPGTIVIDVTVSPPGAIPYHVRGLRLTTKERRGDATVLERWVDTPYFRYSGELFYRGTNRLVQWAPLSFARTSGAELRGPGLVDGVYHSSTDEFGRVALFPLFAQHVFADRDSEVVGDLHVITGAPGGSVVRNVRLQPTYLYRDAPLVLRLGVGPSLEYQGELKSRGSELPLAGAAVTFERTGGIPVLAPSQTTTTSASGRFTFGLVPLAAGVLEGRLTLSVPPARPETVKVNLRTFEEDGSRFYGVLLAGAWLPHYGIVQAFARGVSGVKVDVHRTGGVGLQPEDFTVETHEGGIFRIAATPLALGEVVLDLTIRAPAPFQTFTVRGVRLAVSDRSVPDQLFGVYDLDRPPASPNAVAHP